jgi:5-methylcytosine-specific restriction endonuclease McrA
MMGHVLILNRHFCPVQITTWERALTLLYLDHAAAVDESYRTYDFEAWLQIYARLRPAPARIVHTARINIAVPEVLVLKLYDQVPFREIAFTRRNIYHHYGHRCCYCGKNFPPNELNLDHVVPRSRGGSTDWTNIVTACIPCNLKKGNRLPAEAGMRLLLPVSRPKFHSERVLFSRYSLPIRNSWKMFLNGAEQIEFRAAESPG